MLEDRYGNTLSTNSYGARDAYVEGVDHILAGTFGATQAFARALDADPDFALASAGHARALMYDGDMAAAKVAITQAETMPGADDPRAASHIAIFNAMLSGQAAVARKRVEAHVALYPRDALAAQAGTNVFGLIGFSGCAEREAALLAYTSALSPHYGQDWWMMSMHALSLCETGAVIKSLELMDHALELNPRNANGAHFKAHAQYELGKAEDGLAYLNDWMPGYDRRAILHGHISWHMALWSLYLGDFDQMWATIDTAIVPEHSESLPINVLTDTAAIYWRAELLGVEVTPDRWATLSRYAGEKFPKSGQSFADAHAAMCHAMAGDGAALDRLASTKNGYAGDMVPPLTRAWRAMARKDWTEALTQLTPVMADHARLGGSRAQRDLLELTLANLLMRLGRNEEARRMITMRRPVLSELIPTSALN